MSRDLFPSSGGNPKSPTFQVHIPVTHEAEGTDTVEMRLCACVRTNGMTQVRLEITW